jgi:hypothetical protein
MGTELSREAAHAAADRQLEGLVAASRALLREQKPTQKVSGNGLSARLEQQKVRDRVERRANTERVARRSQS